jgi:hypothetical protein
VGWACMLYSDLINHWKKRNIAALENTDPANLNLETIREAFLRYGTKALRARTDQLDALRRLGADFEPVDDFERCGITGPEDIRDLFVDHFYFGCETDDPITAWAFRDEVNPAGVRLHAMMGSDIGHFDVMDMTNVLVEAHVLVERRLLDEDAFRDFVFGNAVRLWGGSDPNFFKGTAVEKEAAAIVGETTDFVSAGGAARGRPRFAFRTDARSGWRHQSADSRPSRESRPTGSACPSSRTASGNLRPCGASTVKTDSSSRLSRGTASGRSMARFRLASSVA